MRSVLPVLVATLVVAGCGGILGLRDIDEGVADPTTSDGGASDVAVGPPAEASADAADMRCGSAAALFCDGFEAAALDKRWRTDFRGGGGAGVKPRRHGAVGANRTALIAGFSPIPDEGRALLAYDGLPAGRRALRFSLLVPYDSYPDGLPLAGLVDAAGDGVRVELRVGGGNISLSVRDTRGGAATSLGLIAWDQWTCVEIDLDDAGVLHARRETDLLTGTATTLTAATAKTAEVGMRWTFGGSSNASNNMHYDDVVIGTAPAGCGG